MTKEGQTITLITAHLKSKFLSFPRPWGTSFSPSSEEQRAQLARKHGSDGGLQGSARAVFDGLRLSKARDQNALSALDSQLANSKPTDAWYPQAARRRAEWRRYAGSREAHVDALEILERAPAVGPNTDLLLLRVAHAAALQRYRVILESANLLIVSFAKKIHDKRARPISRSQRRFIHNNAATLGKMIAGIDTPNDGRKKAVLHKVQALLKHMKSTQRERRRSN